MNAIKEFLQKKSVGFYVGAASALLALVTMFLYIGLNSMYFTALVVLFIIGGIIVYGVSVWLDNKAIGAVSYILYMVALYRYLVLEIEYRMDILVDTGLAGLDALFVVTTIFFIVSIIGGIVATCMKQNKE